MDVKSKKHIKDLVDKTIQNHKILIAATKRVNSPAPPFHNDLHKQRDYAEASLHRCRRCGDSVVPVLPSMELSLICKPCEVLLRSWEEPMWFVELLDKASGKSKNVTKAIDTLPDEDKMIYDKEIEEGNK